jgi:hypothetical protein
LPGCSLVAVLKIQGRRGSGFSRQEIAARAWRPHRRARDAAGGLHRR